MCRIANPDIFEVRVEHIFAMATAHSPVVDDEIADYLLGWLLAKIDILSDLTIPVTISLNPVAHRVAIGSGVSYNSVLADIISVVLSCSGQLIWPGERRKRVYSFHEVNSFLDTSWSIIGHESDRISRESHHVSFKVGKKSL